MEDATYTMGSTAYTMRRRPLHTCGVAVLAIGESICARSMEMEGPLGSFTRTLAKRGSLLKPTIFAFIYHWLAFLSLLDDHALDAAMIISLRFPSSNHVFRQVDHAVFIVEKLPERFDHLMNTRVPRLLHRFPLLKAALLTAFSWINSLILVFTMGAFKNANEKQNSIIKDKDKDKDVFSPATTMLGGGDKDPRRSRRRKLRRDSFASHHQLDHNVPQHHLCIEDPILNLFKEGWQAPRTRGTSITRSHSSSL